MPSSEHPILRKSIRLPRPPVWADRIHLIFNIGQSRILHEESSKLLSVAYSWDQGPRTEAAVDTHPNIFSITPQQPRIGATTVEILCLHELPELVRIAYHLKLWRRFLRRLTFGPHLYFVLQGDPCLEDSTTLFEKGEFRDDAGLFGPSDYIDKMDELLADPLLDEHQRKRSRYFFEIEKESVGALVPPYEDDLPHVNSLLLSLGRRQQQRLEDYNGTWDCAPRDFSQVEAHVQDAVQTFEGAMESNQMDEEAVKDAFFEFASGDLRLWLPGADVWTTQPSCGLYFYFGEFALLALETKILVPGLALNKDWLMLARAMVASQEIFVRAYPPYGSAPHVPADYSACAYDDDWPDTEDKADIFASVWASYAALSREELCLASAKNSDDHLKGLLAVST